MTDFFSYIERDLPGQIPPAPKISTSRVRGQGTSAQVLGRSRADVLKYLTDMFIRNGMTPSLARWAYDTIVEGASGTELVQRMYDRPEFRERFRPIFTLQTKYPGMQALSPQDILEWEKNAGGLMRAAGMPPQFYDHWTDFQPQIESGRSFQEFADIVNDGFAKVAAAPRMVRDAFANFYGPSGDAALAAYYLDPTKAKRALLLQTQAAGVAGTGLNFGFTLGKNRAMEAAQLGYGMDNSSDRWASLVQSRPLFNELMGEKDDLTAEDQGAAAVFGLEGGGEALAKTERRRQEREAAFSGGGGPGGSDKSGAKGLGTAQ